MMLSRVVQVHLANPVSITVADPADCASKYLRITHPRSVADSTDGGFSFGAAYQQYDLPEPTGGCQASSIVVDGHVLFAAPASGDEGEIRFARHAASTQSDACSAAWCATCCRRSARRVSGRSAHRRSPALPLDLT